MSETLFGQANPTGVSGYATTTENGSYGVYFTVTASCNLTAIWFYSPSGATSLPTSTALYSTAAGTSGTLLAQNSSPSWSGAAGSGWVRDNSFPATAVSTGTTYVGQYYGASFKQGYLYTGSFPGPWYPATSSPSGLAVAGTQYFGGDSNAPYLNSSNGFPASTLGAGVNWLCDVEVSLPVTLPTAAMPPYQPPAWHPASGPGMPGGEPFAQYPPAPYALAVAPVTPATGPWTLFGASGNGATGPATATSNSGDWISGVAFQVTQGGQWFEGYWWWVCGSGQSTSPVKCALWNAYQPSGISGTLISGSVITSGTLTAGQWNWIPLPVPVPLAIATTYIAAIGVNGNYPDTTAQFGSGDPYSAGITSGPLSAFSAQNGSNPDPYTLIGNGILSTAGTDPSVTIPGTASATYDNLWVDVQISGAVPAGYSGPFPVWPNKYDADTYTTADSSVNYVVGTEFWLSEPCLVDQIRYFSPPGTAQLATSVTIWNVVTQAQAYNNTSPSWSGAAASGWVSMTPSGVTLQPGAYRVTVFNNAATPDGWSAKRFGYWGGGGTVPGGGPQVTAAGLTLGPLYVPSTAQANNCYEYDSSGAGNTPPFSFPDGRQEPGQSVFADSGSNTYPALYVDGGYQNYWVDVSLTSTAQQGSGTAAGGGTLAGTGAKAATGSSGITGAGTVSGHGVKGGAGTGTVTAGGTPAGTGTKAATGTSKGTATGTPGGTGSKAATGAGKTAGTGSLSGAGAKTAPGSSSLASGAGLSPDGQKGADGTSGTSGTGTSAPSGKRSAAGTGTVTATGTAAGAGRKAATGTGTVAAGGTAVPAGSKGAEGGSGLAGNAGIATPPNTAGTGTGTAAAGTALKSAGFKAVTGSSGISGAGGASAAGRKGAQAYGTVAATGSLVAAGARHASGTGQLAACGAPSGAGKRHATGTSGIASGGGPGAVQAPQITGSSAITGSAATGGAEQPSRITLWTVTGARQLWTAGTARQLWTTGTARN